MVLLELTDSATEAERSAIIEALRELPSRIPAIRDYRCGFDKGLAEGNVELGVTADFDDEAGYLQYATHPAHLEVIAELIKPVLAARTAAQIEI